ncbi:MAG: response regulator [Leptospiraceae bacterium]|nr:response regulator [Leptospiraceae bacterium]MCZ8347233.1 response regulator [Leptospiraceae bacterium]PJE01314.1 MAG: adenylate/guanylate cyclase domain-containing response regulator [Leptospira sp.]
MKDSKILFAEDSTIQGTILKKLLTQRGFDVRWAKNGEEGWNLLQDFQPSLIISDVEMPILDGYEFCSRIKKDLNFRNIPVVLCSSLSDPEDIIRGIECGANGYITKPYEESFLMYRIESILNNMEQDVEDNNPIDVQYAGKTYTIQASKMHMMQILLSIYENTVKKNKELLITQIDLQHKAQELEKSLQESERLLRNILPEKIADRLKSQGFDKPEYFESVSVLFTDFKGFTDVAEFMSPDELVEQLDLCFAQFDAIVEMYGVEKLKTIGDSYMAAGGIPVSNQTHPVDLIRAAMEIKQFMDMTKNLRKDQGLPYWELRIGIHTGPVVAGVIGNKKFAYDMWGDTVNTASRMESSGEVGRVNISRDTYEKVKDFFLCHYRGKIPAKNKGSIDMFFVERIHPELSRDEEGLVPNDNFFSLYKKLTGK